MKDLLFFNDMVTPKVITLLYWLMLLSAVYTGLQGMFGGFGGMTFEKFVIGATWIGGGGLAARIWCEMIIVLFKIHDNLKTLASKE